MAKLNFYKFVNPGGLRDKNLESITIDAKKYAIRKGGKGAGGGSDVTNAITGGNRKTLLATNRIGASLNSSLVALDEVDQTQKKLSENLLGINKSVVDQTKKEEKHRKKLYDVLKRQTTLKRGQESEAASENRGPKDGKDKKGGAVEAVGKAAGGILGFLSGLVARFVGPLLALGVVEWLSKPGNAEKAAQFLKFVGNIAKFFMKVIEFGVFQTLEGLAKLFDSDANIFQKIIGFFQLTLGVFTLLGTWALLTGKWGLIAKGLKLAWAGIQALPVALSLAAKAATAIKTFASTPVGKAAILFGAGAAIPALFPGTVETTTDAAVDKSKEEKGADTTLEKLKQERANVSPLDYITGKTAELDKQIYRLEKGEEPNFGFGKDGVGPDKVPTAPTVTPNDPAGKQKGKTVSGASGRTYVVELDGKPQPLSKEAQADIDQANKTRSALGEPQQFERGGISSGPDAGYPAILHGTEAVIPIDNKFTRSGGNPLANLLGKEQEKTIPEDKTVRGLVGTKSVTIGTVNPDQKWNPNTSDTSMRGLLATLVTGIKYQAELFAKVMGVKLKDPVSDTPTDTEGTGSTDAPAAAPAGTNNAPSGSTNPPPAAPPAIDQSSLEKKTLDELKKMLDPTVSGAKDPKVFEAAKAAREKYKDAPAEERERQVLMATIIAKQGSNVPTPTPATTEPPKFASGGGLNNVISGSGYINGPMSGYPVYMNGGTTPSFIGHGLEYVTTKSKGGFVIPIETPATRSQGGLFGRRVQEATSKGFKHPFSVGGLLEYQGGGQLRRSKTGESKSEKESPPQPKLHPYLVKLSDKNIKKAISKDGYCVTGSLDTMQRSGVPNPDATGNDVGNNPRGAAVQLIKSFGWKSIGGTRTTLKSPYGTVSAGIFSKSQYDTAVKEGKIPSGALIFQTRHASWNGTSPRSRGYDMAIAQKKGTALWNGQPLGQWVYGGGTKHVIALTPNGVTGDGKPPEISGSDDPSAAANGVGPGSDPTQEPEQTPEQAFASAIEKLISAAEGSKSAFAEMGPSAAETSASTSTPSTGQLIEAKSKDLHKAFTEPSNLTPEVINQSFTGAAPPIINTDSTPIHIPNYEGGVSPWKFEGHILFTDGIGSTQELSKIK